MSFRPVRTRWSGGPATGSGPVSSLGRIRPLLAVGVLSLALVTGCSSDDSADDSSAPVTTASTGGSAEVESSSAPSADAGDDTSAEAPSSASDSAAQPAPSDSAAAPSGEATPSTAAPSGEPAPGSDAAPDEAVEGTSCGGLTVAAVNEAIGGGALESAIDTADPATGDVSCIFGTTTTIDSVLVDKASLTTYLGGELDGLSDAEVLDNLAAVHSSTQTEVESVDSTVAGLTVRTLTGTDVTGAANALSVTVTDGTLVAVSAGGPALAESGLAEATLAVLGLALES